MPSEDTRVLFPATGFSTRDLERTYLALAPVLLPHLRDRPISFRRFPGEVGDESYWEKDAPGFTPAWVRTVPVPRVSGANDIRYIMVEDEHTLAWAAQVGCIEIHPFLHCYPEIDRPASIVFDLDPGEGFGLAQCCEAALLLRDFFASFRIELFPKTSGGKGIQVYLPLASAVTYAATREFAKRTALQLEQQNPRLIVTGSARAIRARRVLIDWSQNSDFKTTVCVYSLRAGANVPYVSMPLTWAEVEGGAGGEQSDALRFQPEEAIARIGKVGDLFAAVLKLRQTLPGELMTEWRIPTGRLNLVSLERRVGPAEETARSSGQGSRKHFIAYRRGRNIEIGLDLGDHHIWRADVDAFGTVRDEAARATELHHIGSSQPPGRETVWDEGTCEVVEGSYRSGSLRLYFSGQRLRGEWSLRRRQDDWEFQHLISSPGKVITLDRAHQKGPVSDESAIAKGGVVLPDWSSLPNGSARFIQPMEADEVDSPSDLPTDRERWAYEVKWDGYRGIYVKQGTAVRLYGRSGKTIENCRHEHLDAALANSRFDDGVLDGEIVAFQNGVASFQALQNSLRNNAPVVFVVFDILNYAGRDTTPLPYVQRRQVLRSVQPLLPQEFPVPEPLDADIARMLESFKEKQIEGVVAKRRDADYRPGKRSPAWVKYWIGQVGEFVVGGYLPGKDRYFEAVAVGEYIGDALVYREQIRHGFTAADKEAIYRAISRNSIAECPFANLPQRKRRGAVDQIRMDQYVWVKPELRVLMRYKERTAAGEIREHGKFLGIARPDAA